MKTSWPIGSSSRLFFRALLRSFAKGESGSVFASLSNRSFRCEFMFFNWLRDSLIHNLSVQGFSRFEPCNRLLCPEAKRGDSVSFRLGD